MAEKYVGRHRAKRSRWKAVGVLGLIAAFLLSACGYATLVTATDTANDLPDPVPHGPAYTVPVLELDPAAEIVSRHQWRSDPSVALGDPTVVEQAEVNDGTVPLTPVVDIATTETGEWVRPVPGPITSGFGLRFHPILKVTKSHNGIDIAAACGTPVRAAKDGTISAAGELGGYGLRVEIDHGQIHTLYAHLSSIGVRPGQTVVKGQVIAMSGTTGMSTGCHLHFETIVGGVKTDPATVVTWAAGTSLPPVDGYVSVQTAKPTTAPTPVPSVAPPPTQPPAPVVPTPLAPATDSAPTVAPTAAPTPSPTATNDPTPTAEPTATSDPGPSTSASAPTSP